MFDTPQTHPVTHVPLVLLITLWYDTFYRISIVPTFSSRDSPVNFCFPDVIYTLNAFKEDDMKPNPHWPPLILVHSDLIPNLLSYLFVFLISSFQSYDMLINPCKNQALIPVVGIWRAFYRHYNNESKALEAKTPERLYLYL